MAVFTDVAHKIFTLALSLWERGLLGLFFGLGAALPSDV